MYLLPFSFALEEKNSMTYFYGLDGDWNQASDSNVTPDTDQVNNISLWPFFKNMMCRLPIKVP